MRISELARRGGVPVATVKYYLREGLVPTGTLTSSTQARYDDEHVARLQLVRALVGPGALTIAQAKDVLRAIDEPAGDLFDALAHAQHAIAGPADDVDPSPARELLERTGWAVDPDSPEVAQLARALAAAQDAGFQIPDDVMRAYIEASETIATAEIAGIPQDRGAGIRYAVLGTILAEPVLSALRRLAQQHASAQRFRTDATDNGS